MLAVSAAIVAHRDLGALFHELADRLHQVVRFDLLVCVLHDATSNTMRLHVLGTRNPFQVRHLALFRVEEDPAGIVFQTQHPLIISNVAEENRWPQFSERAKPYGVNSTRVLPLTTAHRRLGVLGYGCKQASAYDRRMWTSCSRSPTKWPWPWRTPWPSTRSRRPEQPDEDENIVGDACQNLPLCPNGDDICR